MTAGEHISTLSSSSSEFLNTIEWKILQKNWNDPTASIESIILAHEQFTHSQCGRRVNPLLQFRNTLTTLYALDDKTTSMSIKNGNKRYTLVFPNSEQVTYTFTKKTPFMQFFHPDNSKNSLTSPEINFLSTQFDSRWLRRLIHLGAAYSLWRINTLSHNSLITPTTLKDISYALYYALIQNHSRHNFLIAPYTLSLFLQDQI